MFVSIIALIIFFLGLAFISRNNYKNIEGFDNIDKRTCGTMLIQKGQKLYLYNSNVAKVPGVNPLTFDNLEEYIEYTQWQRANGIRCPVLYLQKSYDTQNNSIYKIRPSPTELGAGLPDMNFSEDDEALFLRPAPESKLLDAGRDDLPFNQNSYPAFDPQDQYIGLNTPLDKMFHDTVNPVSANPMDPNWGGKKYTQELVKEGDYKGDYVMKPIEKVDVNRNNNDKNTSRLAKMQ